MPIYTVDTHRHLLFASKTNVINDVVQSHQGKIIFHDWPKNVSDIILKQFLIIKLKYGVDTHHHFTVIS